MNETREHVAELGWPAEVQTGVTSGSAACRRFINEHVLPRLNDLNRPAKILEPSGLMWGAAKRQSVVSVSVAEGFRVYSRNGAVIGGRVDQATSLASDLAEQAQESKNLVKKYFQSAGLPVSPGRTFSPGESQAATDYACSLQGQIVLKPDTRSAGISVFTQLQNAEDFRRAWSHLTSTVEGDALIEQRHSGLPLRVYVVGERVVGTLVRLPMFVIGDGVRNLSALTQLLLKWRAQNIFLRRMNPSPEVLRKRMARMGLDPEGTPALGELQFIQERPNVHGGALSVDVSDDISEGIRDLAADALWSVPGLRAGGVDLSVESLDDPAGAVAVGVNSRANMTLHEYPAFGKSRPVAGALVTHFLRSGRTAAP